MRKHTLMAGLVALTVASPGFARADDQPIETQVVDAMNKAFGTHPGFRANHAKGLVVEGSFKASSRGTDVEQGGFVQWQYDPGDGAILRFDGNAECAGRV